MRTCVLFFLFSLGSTWLAAAQIPQNTFMGCVNRLPNGTLQFGEIPSGEVFLLRGQANLLSAHVSQLIRVSGDVSRRSNGSNASPMLTVVRVQRLSGSCASALPTKRFERVPGKVGEDLVAVPDTTTLADDQTTPGFQTQEGRVRAKRLHSRLQEQPAVPTCPDQVAQSEAAANVNASSVDRTEILPGHTLGVSGSEGMTNTSEAINPNGSNPAKSFQKPATMR